MCFILCTNFADELMCILICSISEKFQNRLKFKKKLKDTSLIRLYASGTFLLQKNHQLHVRTNK